MKRTPRDEWIDPLRLRSARRAREEWESLYRADPWLLRFGAVVWVLAVGTSLYGIACIIGDWWAGRPIR